MPKAHQLHHEEFCGAQATWNSTLLALVDIYRVKMLQVEQEMHSIRCSMTAATGDVLDRLRRYLSQLDIDHMHYRGTLELAKEMLSDCADHAA